MPIIFIYYICADRWSVWNSDKRHVEPPVLSITDLQLCSHELNLLILFKVPL